MIDLLKLEGKIVKAKRLGYDGAYDGPSQFEDPDPWNLDGQYSSDAVTGKLDVRTFVGLKIAGVPLPHFVQYTVGGQEVDPTTVELIPDVAAHLAGQHNQQDHAGAYKAVSSMSRKEMLVELKEVHEYTGPTSYTKDKLGSIVQEQRKATSGIPAPEKAKKAKKAQETLDDGLIDWSKYEKPAAKPTKYEPDAPAAVGPNRGKRLTTVSEANVYAANAMGDAPVRVGDADIGQINDGYIFASDELNGTLRHHPPPAGFEAKTVEALDRYIAATPPLKEDLVVHRGFGSSSSLLQQPVGTVFQDDGYVSTSLSSKVAQGFVSGGPFNDKIVAEIKVPRGRKGAFLSPIDAHYGGEEAEFLLPRGSQFKITGTRPGDRMTIVELELV